MADGGFALAQAFVRIRPTNTGFRAEATSQVKSALAGVEGEVPLNVGTDKAKASINVLKDYLQTLTKRLWAVDIIADDKTFQLQIANILNQLRTIDKRISSPKVRLEGISKAGAQLVGLDLKLDEISAKVATAHINIDDSSAEQKIALLIVQLAALSQRVNGITISSTDDANLQKLQILKDTIQALSGRALTIDLNDSEAMNAIRELDLGVRRVTADSDALAKGLRDAAAAGGGGRGGGFLGRLGSVPLFGGGAGAVAGITASVTGIHLLVDGIIEFLAVVIPATIALTAFGIAAAGPVSDLIQQYQTFNTVGLATNRNLLPLAGTFSKVQDAVRPQVYALLGDALQVAGNKAGFFSKLATGAGSAIDQLFSRATLAVQSSGFTKFLANATPDLDKLGTVIGNVFGILGNLLKTMPGYAEVLLNVLVAITHALEVFTSSGIVQGILKVGLAMHGFFLYAGLASTAAILLGTPLANLAGRFGLLGNTADGARAKLAANAGILSKSQAAWSDLGNAAQIASVKFKGGEAAVAKTGEEAGAAAGKTNLWGKALKFLTNIPAWGWVAIGAAAVAGLIYLFTSARNSTTAWATSLQANIDRQQSFQGVVKATTLAVNTAQLQVGVASVKLTQTIHDQASAYQVTAGKAGGFNQAVMNASQNLNDAQRASANFNAEQVATRTHITDLIGKFGSLNIAEGLWNQAQIKSSDLSTTNQATWNQDVQTLISLQNALKAVAYSAGVSGANERVLNFTLSDQYTNVQKLNSAWDTFIGVVTGGQSAFDTYATGLGAVKSAADKTRTSIDGLSNNSIALNQAFTTQVTNTNALIDQWRQAGLTGKQFTEGVKLSIAPLLKYASGSKEATAQLLALAQEAGYHGPQSLRMLSLWVGNTSNAESKLKQITDQVTMTESNLTNALQGQGNYIGNKLIGEINNAILSYNGVYKAAQAYGNAVAEDGAKSTQARSARQQLINDLIASGHAASQSKDEIAALITKVLGIPIKRSLQIVMSGLGKYSIVGQAAASATQSPGGPQIRIRNGATGFRIPGYGGGDKHPAMLEAGESVVPKHLTPLVAPLLASHGVPGFAAGVINVGNSSVLSGVYAQQMYQTFQTSMLKTMLSSMSAALQSAAAMSGVSGRVSSYASAVLKVLGMLGQPAGDLGIVLRQMTTESGGNAYAVNRSDINWQNGTPSVGLMQVIGPTFAAYAGPYRGLGPFEYGVSVNPLANIYAGLNYAIHRYGSAWTGILGQGHGYDKGGWLPPGLSLAFNGTGRPEPVGPVAQPTIILQVAAAGGTAFEQFMVMAISRWVHVRGGGNVQVAFGSG